MAIPAQYTTLEIPFTIDDEFLVEHQLIDFGCYVTEDGKVRPMDAPDKQILMPAARRRDPAEYHALRLTFERAIQIEIVQRLEEEADLKTIWLPQQTYDRPEDKAVPILITNPSKLKDKERLLLVVNDFNKDLAIWDYRMILDDDLGIYEGSVLGLAMRLKDDEDAPGLVILNPGQEFWVDLNSSCVTSHAFTRYEIAIGSWKPHGIAKPEDYAHTPQEKDIELKRSAQSIHLLKGLQFLMNPSFFSRTATVSIIAIGHGGTTVIDDLLHRDAAEEKLENLIGRISRIAWVCHPVDTTRILRPRNAAATTREIIQKSSRAFVRDLKQIRGTLMDKDGDRISEAQAQELGYRETPEGSRYFIAEVSIGIPREEYHATKDALPLALDWLGVPRPASASAVQGP